MFVCSGERGGTVRGLYSIASGGSSAVSGNRETATRCCLPTQACEQLRIILSTEHTQTRTQALYSIEVVHAHPDFSASIFTAAICLPAEQLRYCKAPIRSTIKLTSQMHTHTHTCT